MLTTRYPPFAPEVIVLSNDNLLVVGHAESEAFAHLDDWQRRALFVAEDLLPGLSDEFEVIVVEQRSRPMVRDGVTYDVDDSTLLARRRP